jgi:hypothetical protein
MSAAQSPDSIRRIYRRQIIRNRSRIHLKLDLVLFGKRRRLAGLKKRLRQVLVAYTTTLSS